MDFAEEIDHCDLVFEEIVGKGAFGVVRRATYKGISVAVKLIETESEKKAFITELKQLSRVSHPNIVKLYGACTKQPVCLVMEYAEGGSLYNVLHGAGPQPAYTAAHAISWALQCAKGVEYLHSMKPKALIHRDLKPPNLLLIMGGKVLKICDFGTACDIQTHMTNNKGSAAWMAPEVFEGSNYSEKCDVFSWGIILWEIFTRKKPFDEMGGPAFRIMWAVHQGIRPPLIKNLPPPLEHLMTSCWAGKHQERPSMSQVVNIMSQVFQYFHGADKPLEYPQQTDIETAETPAAYRSPPVTSNNCFVTSSGSVLTHTSPTYSDTVCQPMNIIDHGVQPPNQTMHQVNTQVIYPPGTYTYQPISAPASLAASRENLLDNRSNTKPTSQIPVEPPARVAHPVLGHRRSGSYGNDIPIQRNNNFDNNLFRSTSVNMLYFADVINGQGPPSRSSSPVKPLQHGNSISDVVSHQSPTSVVDQMYFPPMATPDALSHDNLNSNSYLLQFDPLEQQHQPLTPYPTCKESMDIYNEHILLAQKFMRAKLHYQYLRQKKKELIEDYDSGDIYISDTEYSGLKLLHDNLRKQVEQIKRD
ncbi:mitogen-activated protein kinase kinase kinase 7-like [Argonauta hians]